MAPDASSAPPGAPKKRGLFYGWWVVFAGMMANFAYAEQFNSSYGVFVYQIGLELGWGRTALAGVQSVGRIPEAIGAAFLGGFVDRYGTRWLTLLGGIIVGVAFLALATIHEVWELYLYRGLGMPLGAICLGGFIGVTITNWFVTRRGRALSLINIGSLTATALMPLLGAYMIDNWGWRQAWVIMGGLVVLLVIPAAIVFRRRPEDLGLHPDGLAPDEVRARPASARERRRQQELLAADVPWRRQQVLRTPVFWIMTFAWGLAGFAITATNLHLVPFMMDLGYPIAVAAGAVSVRAVTAMIGSPIWGFLSERVPVNLAASLQFLCKAGAMLAFLLFPNDIGILGGLVLYGIGNAGSSILSEMIWAQYYGRISLGTVRGLVYPIQMGIGAVGPLVMGLMYDMSGSYQASWLALAIGFVFSAIIIQFSRRPKHPGLPPQDAIL